MTARVKSMPRASAKVVALVAMLSAVFAPGALAATHPLGTKPITTTSTSKPPSFPIPASERLGNATAAKTTSPTAQPTATTNTPASALPTPSASPTPNPAGERPATGKPSTATPGATTAPAQTQAPSAAARTLTPAGAPLASAHKGHSGATHLSTAALIVAIVAGLVALFSAIWVLLRWLAPEPRWARSLMYSVDEASFRASATWAEFTDWVRLGR